LELQIPNTRPDVNGFFKTNWDHLVLVGFAQWVIHDLLKDRIAFVAACTTTEGSELSAILIGKEFTAAVGTISWPKNPGSKRFFESSWPPTRSPTHPRRVALWATR
jgi:hypothetical protein